MPLYPTTLVPAYGRRYHSVDDMMDDWNAGADFKLYGGGPYCSKRDMLKLQDCSSSIRLLDPSTLVSAQIWSI